MAEYAAPEEDGNSYKVVLVGEPGVGKTSIFLRLLNNTFAEEATSTIGVDYCTKTVTVDGRQITLKVWDTAGIERFRSATTQLSSFYRNADAAIFVYSVDDTLSLHSLASWLQDLQCFGPDASRFLVGSKSDLEMDVDLSTARSFAISHDFVPPFLTSAKTNAGIQEMFEAIAAALHKRVRGQNQTGTVDLIADTLNDGGAYGENGCSC